MNQERILKDIRKYEKILKQNQEQNKELQKLIEQTENEIQTIAKENELLKFHNKTNNKKPSHFSAPSFPKLNQKNQPKESILLITETQLL